MLRHSLSEN